MRHPRISRWLGRMLAGLCVLFHLANAHAADELELSPGTNLKEAQKRLRPRRLALLLGIWKYQHTAWNDLRYPQKDAQKMARFLRSEGQFDDIALHTSTKETTRQGIRSALQWLKKQNQLADDTVVIYISGHGTIAQRKHASSPERYIVTSDSTAHIPQTGLALAEVKALMDALPSRQKVLILATCYVGNTTIEAVPTSRSKALHSGIKGTYTLGSLSRTTLILSAAGYMQPAYELSQVQGDVYTHFLLACARDIRKTQRDVAASKAHQCATTRTYQFIKKTLGREQIPTIESKIMGNETLFFTRRSPLRLTQKTASKHYGWLQLRRDRYQRLQVQPVGAKGGLQEYPIQGLHGQWLLRLPTGRYRVLLHDAEGHPIERFLSIEDQRTAYLDPDDSTPMFDVPTRQYGPIYTHTMGGSLLFSGDFMLDGQMSFGARAAFFHTHFQLGISALFGTAKDYLGNPIESPLMRFGLFGTLGYPLKFAKWDLYLGGYAEIGAWNTREATPEMVFLLAYGPYLRLRWWFSPQAALQLSAGIYFSVSPDQPTSTDRVNTSYAWSHRFNSFFSIGFAFSGPD
ncbi:MAG: caspase family protein [Myxococcales bacterium]|nr:caspase family protein [Myxococcales bacterium]MCB9644895.1 caspase family protein [Myxococcales bacterium]